MISLITYTNINFNDNFVPVTFSELLLNPINNTKFLIKIKNDLTKEIKNLYVNSVYHSKRYDLIQIITTDNIVNEDLGNGVIKLEGGTFDYETWELDFLLTPIGTQPIEIGKIYNKII